MFSAYNPPSNFYQGVELTLEIFLTDQFFYPIAEIEGGLIPSFECNYPCETCNPYDPSDCESCPEGPFGTKEFLQVDPQTNKKTCKTECDLGYTFDRDEAKICLPCDPSCATCRQGGGEEDRRVCTSCAPGFPYAWIEAGKCFSQELGCPAGTYEYTLFRCRACTEGCQLCSSGVQCEVCDPKSTRPLLQNNVCVESCMEGKTPYFNKDSGVCLPCKLPCATCADGQPSSCLSCAEGDSQFLFGS